MQHKAYGRRASPNLCECRHLHASGIRVKGQKETGACLEGWAGALSRLMGAAGRGTTCGLAMHVRAQSPQLGITQPRSHLCSCMMIQLQQRFIIRLIEIPAYHLGRIEQHYTELSNDKTCTLQSCCQLHAARKMSYVEGRSREERAPV